MSAYITRKSQGRKAFYKVFTYLLLLSSKVRVDSDKFVRMNALNSPATSARHTKFGIEMPLYHMQHISNIIFSHRYRSCRYSQKILEPASGSFPSAIKFELDNSTTGRSRIWKNHRQDHRYTAWPRSLCVTIERTSHNDHMGDAARCTFHICYVQRGRWRCRFGSGQWSWFWSWFRFRRHALLLLLLLLLPTTTPRCYSCSFNSELATNSSAKFECPTTTTTVQGERQWGCSVLLLLSLCMRSVRWQSQPAGCSTSYASPATPPFPTLS